MEAFYGVLQGGLFASTKIEMFKRSSCILAWLQSVARKVYCEHGSGINFGRQAQQRCMNAGNYKPVDYTPMHDGGSANGRCKKGKAGFTQRRGSSVLPQVPVHSRPEKVEEDVGCRWLSLAVVAVRTSARRAIQVSQSRHFAAFASGEGADFQSCTQPRFLLCTDDMRL